MVEYRPLDEVTEEVRRAIARERAQAEMDLAISEVRKIVEAHAKDRLAWRFTQEQNPSEPAPTPPSFAEITSKYPAMSVGQTPLVDRYEVEEHEIGEATELSFSGQQLYEMKFADMAFWPKQCDVPAQNISVQRIRRRTVRVLENRGKGSFRADVGGSSGFGHPVLEIPAGAGRQVGIRGSGEGCRTSSQSA